MDDTYLDILRIVEEVTGISASDFLTSNCEEHVDARHILVAIMSERGYSDSRIAKMINLTRPCVCMIRNNFKYRKRRYFVNVHYENIRERVFGKEYVRS